MVCMHERQRRAISYLLRLWQIESHGQITWRASLDEAQGGERHGFPDLEALIAFLRERTGAGLDDSARQDAT
jgi:hypothetical protein